MNKKTNTGESCLMAACKISSQKCFNLLIEHGADPYALSNEGNSVLHYACNFENAGLCPKLLGDILKVLKIKSGEEGLAKMINSRSSGLGLPLDLLLNQWTENYRQFYFAECLDLLLRNGALMTLISFGEFKFHISVVKFQEKISPISRKN